MAGAASPFMGAALRCLTFRGALLLDAAPRRQPYAFMRAETAACDKPPILGAGCCVIPADASRDSLVRVGRLWEALVMVGLKTRASLDLERPLSRRSHRIRNSAPPAP